MTKYQRSVLVVEDEHFIRALVSDKLINDGFRVQTAANAREARKITDAGDVDVVILDIDLGAGPNGLDFAVAMNKLHPEMARVLHTITKSVYPCGMLLIVVAAVPPGVAVANNVQVCGILSPKQFHKEQCVNIVQKQFLEQK